MKQLKKMLTALCLILSMAVTSPIVAPQTVATVEAKAAAKTYKVNAGKKVKVSLLKGYSNVKYATSNKKVATVDKKGNVKGVKAGTVTITAKSGRKSASCKVVVSAVLNKTKAEVAADKKIVLKLVGAPAKVAWSTSNKKIATVNAKGQVTGVRPGKVTITAKCAKKTYRCAVTVGVDSATAIKKVSVRYEECPCYTVAFVTNKNVYPIQIYASAQYYDAQKKSIAMKLGSKDSNYCLEPNKTTILLLPHPKKNGNYYIPASKKVTYTAKKVVAKKWNVGAMMSNDGHIEDKMLGEKRAYYSIANLSTKETFDYVFFTVLVYRDNQLLYAYHENNQMESLIPRSMKKYEKSLCNLDGSSTFGTYYQANKIVINFDSAYCY
ncbi:MAG: Ig-like domain-containing protein [Agathobacter sp.]|uniref:Ig-like domain-containing protein n=1 Tax=Agathobacter sp. TaxID=2021311 RepID=UPI00258907A4|nr:Ig-like domain-containing protein [Agathobacter sp.]MCR5676446.1 Ig-like domain-containing protein [Agathobacter sp.]